MFIKLFDILETYLCQAIKLIKFTGMETNIANLCISKVCIKLNIENQNFLKMLKLLDQQMEIIYLSF